MQGCFEYLDRLMDEVKIAEIPEEEKEYVASRLEELVSMLRDN